MCRSSRPRGDPIGAVTGDSRGPPLFAPLACHLLAPLVSPLRPASDKSLAVYLYNSEGAVIGKLRVWVSWGRHGFDGAHVWVWSSEPRSAMVVLVKQAGKQQLPIRVALAVVLNKT